MNLVENHNIHKIPFSDSQDSQALNSNLTHSSQAQDNYTSELPVSIKERENAANPGINDKLEENILRSENVIECEKNQKELKSEYKEGNQCYQNQDPDITQDLNHNLPNDKNTNSSSKCIKNNENIEMMKDIDNNISISIPNSNTNQNQNQNPNIIECNKIEEKVEVKEDIEWWKEYEQIIDQQSKEVNDNNNNPQEAYIQNQYHEQQKQFEQDEQQEIKKEKEIEKEKEKENEIISDEKSILKIEANQNSLFKINKLNQVILNDNSESQTKNSEKYNIGRKEDNNPKEKEEKKEDKEDNKAIENPNYFIEEDLKMTHQISENSEERLNIYNIIDPTKRGLSANSFSPVISFPKSKEIKPEEDEEDKKQEMKIEKQSNFNSIPKNIQDVERINFEIFLSRFFSFHFIILQYLLPKEIFTLTITCRLLRNYISRDQMWKKLISRQSSFSSLPIKLLYVRQQSILTNLYKNKYHSYHLLGHNRQITSIAIEGSKILSGSVESVVKLWDITTKKTKNLDLHKGTITKVMFNNNIPISCSIDRNIIVWGDENIKPKVLKGHRSGVTNLSIVNPETIVSSSHDKSIKIWNINKSKPLASHSEGSNISQLSSNNNLVTFSLEIYSKIFVLDANKFQLKYAIPLNNNGPGQNANVIDSLLIAEPNYLFSGEFRKVRMFDMRMKTEVDKEQLIFNINNVDFPSPPSYASAGGAHKIRFQETYNTLLSFFNCVNGIVSYDVRVPSSILCCYEAHKYPVTSFDSGKYFNEHVMASCASTKTFNYDLKIFDIRKHLNDQKPGDVLLGHNSAITRLKMQDGLIATGGKNGLIIVMEFSEVDHTQKIFPKTSKIVCK